MNRVCKYCEYNEVEKGLTSCEDCNYEIATNPEVRELLAKRFPKDVPYWEIDQ